MEVFLLEVKKDYYNGIVSVETYEVNANTVEDAISSLRWHLNPVNVTTIEPSISIRQKGN